MGNSGDEQGTDETLAFEGKRDIVVRKLRDALLRGDYMVGDRLRQSEIAARYGASPTPVREALRILEAQGFVRHTPHRGVTVADVSGTFRQLYRLREALECLATEMAVERMTPQRASQLSAAAVAIEEAERTGDDQAQRRAHNQFDLVLYEACGFPTLVELIRAVWARWRWDRLLPVTGVHSAPQHLLVARLAEQGDAAGAAEVLRQHLRSVQQALEAAMGGPCDAEMAPAKDGDCSPKASGLIVPPRAP